MNACDFASIYGSHSKNPFGHGSILSSCVIVRISLIDLGSYVRVNFLLRITKPVTKQEAMIPWNIREDTNADVDELASADIFGSLVCIYLLFYPVVFLFVLFCYSVMVLDGCCYTLECCNGQ